MNRRVLIATAVALAAVCVLFVGSAAIIGDVGRAWEIFAGLSDPWGDSQFVSVPLSIVGYLVVPAIVGLSVSAGLSWWAIRTTKSLDEVTAQLKRRLEGEELR